MTMPGRRVRVGYLAVTVTVVSPIGQFSCGALMGNVLPAMVNVWASRSTVTRWTGAGDGRGTDVAGGVAGLLGGEPRAPEVTVTTAASCRQRPGGEQNASAAAAACRPAPHLCSRGGGRCRAARGQATKPGGQLRLGQGVR